MESQKPQKIEAHQYQFELFPADAQFTNALLTNPRGATNICVKKNAETNFQDISFAEVLGLSPVPRICLNEIKLADPSQHLEPVLRRQSLYPGYPD